YLEQLAFQFPYRELHGINQGIITELVLHSRSFSDSPFTVQCTGKGAGRKREEIARKAEQAGLALVGKEALLYLLLPNVAPMDSCARILDPKGRTEDVEMRDVGGQLFQIRWFPKMEGVHHLSVLNKDAHVYGSPFQFTVGPFAEGGAHKVRASGMGVVRGETNSLQSFNIYTREAGPGNLWCPWRDQASHIWNSRIIRMATAM
ncbi:hypothetical protein OSTOST_20932, partial [Ostertagia ostertagi]